MYAIFIYQEGIYDTHIIQTPSATGIARCAARQPSSMKTSSASLSGPTNRACRAHKLITSGPAIGTQRLTTFCGAHTPSHYLSRRHQQSAQKHIQTSQQLFPCQPTQRCKNNDAVSHRRNGHIKPENYFVDYLVTLG